MLIPGVDAFGREREEEVDVGLEDLGLEHRLHDFVGRAGIGGRLEDDQLSLAQRGGDGFHREHDVREIGVFCFTERRRNADVNRIHRAELRHIGRRAQLPRADHCGEVRFGDIGDVALARIDLGRL